MRSGTDMIRRIAYCAALLGSLSQPASAAEGELGIELNKLEPAESACRAYLVFENRTPNAYSSLKLDLVMFGTDGVIIKRLAVEGGPLAKDKTSVKLFEITDVTCEQIGRVLMNDVISCEDALGERQNCADDVVTTSRSAVSFFK
jgi:hypothetical protein